MIENTQIPRDYLPFWPRLTGSQQELILRQAQLRRIPKDEIVHNGKEDCVGLLLVIEGQLRVFTLSEEGRELTLYRLFPWDMCLFSASCLLKGIDFHVIVQAQQPSLVLHIPPDTYRQLMEESLPVSLYTNELMATHFSDVMWQMDQILNKKMDSRLAALLLEESALAGSDSVSSTHEKLARHLGSAREVVSRLLQYFASEGLIRLGRGSILLLDRPALERLASASLR